MTPGAPRPRRSRRGCRGERQRIQTALGRRIGGGTLGERGNGGAELLEPGCQPGSTAGAAVEWARQLGNGGVDPGEIESEPGHPRLQRTECLLDAAGDTLEALRQRCERRLDPLRPGNGRLDALGEVGDAVVELLGRRGRACPDTLRELGDSILKPSCVLIVVVVRLGRAPRRGGWRGDREELDRRALVGPLLGERARELEAGDGAEVDENLAERLPRLLLLDRRLRDVLLGGKPQLEDDVADPACLSSPAARSCGRTPLRHRWTGAGRPWRSGGWGAHTLRIGIDGVPLAHSSQGEIGIAAGVMPAGLVQGTHEPT